MKKKNFSAFKGHIGSDDNEENVFWEHEVKCFTL